MQVIDPTTVFLSALLVCFALSLFLAGFGNKLVQISHGRQDLKARQSSHSEPTARLGVLALFSGLTMLVVLYPAEPLLVNLLLSALPLIIVGLLEDIGRRQSVNRRFAAAACASLIAMNLFDMLLSRLDVPGLNQLLGFLPVSLAFTLFATVGLTQAFNLIDGLNGLSIFASLISLSALHLIAEASGAHDLHFAILGISGAALGFAAVNFPRGFLFLGDAGAYFMGFSQAWLAVVLIETSADVSPWAVLLVFFWPVADTLFAIFRRWKRGGRAAHADRMHFHHLIMRGLEICVIGKRDRRLSNPGATFLMIPFMATPTVVGVLSWNNTGLAMLATAGFGLIFALSYFALLKAIPSHRSKRKRLAVKTLGVPMAG